MEIDKIVLTIMTASISLIIASFTSTIYLLSISSFDNYLWIKNIFYMVFVIQIILYLICAAYSLKIMNLRDGEGKKSSFGVLKTMFIVAFSLMVVSYLIIFTIKTLII